MGRGRGVDRFILPVAECLAWRSSGRLMLPSGVPVSPLRSSPVPLSLDTLILPVQPGSYVAGPVKRKILVPMFKGEEFQDGSCRGLEQVGPCVVMQVTCLGSCLC